MKDKIFGTLYLAMGIFLVLGTTPTKSFILWVIPPICLILLGIYKIFIQSNK